MALKKAAGLGLAIGAIAVAGCGGGESKSGSDSIRQADGTAVPEERLAGPDQKIAVGSGAEPAGLDPQKSPDDGMYLVLYRVYESLYGFDLDGELEPVLADAPAEVVDDTTWEIALRSGVTFADGTPFDADSVVYSLERILSKSLASEFTEVDTVESVTKVDDTTVRITTKDPDPLLPYRLKSVVMLAPGAADAAGFPRKTNGTGPYALESFDAGNQAVLAYNPEWRDEKPQVTEVTVKFMPDANTRLQALQAGEIDLIPGIGPDQAEQAPQAVQTAAATATGLVRMNAYKGLLADERVRQAINYAVDKEAIAENLFGGFASPASCQLTPVSAGDANPELEAYPHDVEKAKALVEEAGATGKTVELVWSSGVYPLDREVGQVVAQQIEESGLKVKSRFKEYNSWLEDLFVTGEKSPDLIWLETDNSLGNAASQVADFYTTDGQVSAFGTPELDAKVKAAASELDEQARAEQYAEILQETCDSAAVLFLNYRNDIFGMSERLSYAPYAQVYSKLNFEKVQVTK